MRIISGSLKGRVIPNLNIKTTRPTMDRVKESTFAMIEDYLKDSTFLDLFAGSGSIGIEAISHGSKKCYFVDFNKLCTSSLNNIVKKFSIDKYCSILNMDYKKALSFFKNNNIKFDIIYLDPPYKMNCYEEVIKFILEEDLLNNNGIIICEYQDIDLKDEYLDIIKIKEKKYSDKNIAIYKKN